MTVAVESVLHSFIITKGTAMTVEELNKAMGGFLVALGATLPPQLADRIRQQAHALAGGMERNGEPSVAKLTKGFWDAVTASHQPPDTTH